MDNLSLLVVGLGGQGVLVASKIIANVMKEKLCEIKVSQVHGLSQRGGSVVSHIRFGEKVYSPIVEEGGADIIIAFEQIEALRWIKYLKKDGVIILNSHMINPTTVDSSQDIKNYDVVQIIKDNKRKVISVDADELLKEFDSMKYTNILLVGVLMKYLNLEKEICIELIKKEIYNKYIYMNLEAFEKGYDYLQTSIKEEIEVLEFKGITNVEEIIENRHYNFF